MKYFHCSQSLWSDECLKYTTQHARMESLKRLCFKRLQKNHVAKNCQKPSACVHCGRNNHYRSLCSKLFPVDEDKPLKSTLQVIGTQDDTEKTKAEETTMTCGSHVLMQTATAIVKGTLGNQSMVVRIILDS